MQCSNRPAGHKQVHRIGTRAACRRDLAPIESPEPAGTDTAIQQKTKPPEEKGSRDDSTTSAIRLARWTQFPVSSGMYREQ